MGQLEAQGRKLVAAGQQAIADKDWAAAEDSLAQAAEVWATMERRTRGAEKGSYAPYAAAASEALEEVRSLARRCAWPWRPPRWWCINSAPQARRLRGIYTTLFALTDNGAAW